MEVSGRKPDGENSASASSQEDCQTWCEECHWKDSHYVAGTSYCVACSAFLCSTCLQSHRQSFATKDHTVLEGERMPKCKPMKGQQPVLPVRPEHECVDRCKEHTDKVLEYFCHDDRVLACTHCITLKHTGCKKDLVSSISCLPETEKEVSNFIQRLFKLQKDLEEDQKDTEEKQTIVDSLYNKACKNIDNFEEKVKKAISPQADQLKNEAHKLRADDITDLKNAEVSRANLLKEVEQLCTEVDAMMKLNKKSVLFSMMHLENPTITSFLKERLCLNRLSHVNTYLFASNEKILKYFEDKPSLGYIHCFVEQMVPTNPTGSWTIINQETDLDSFRSAPMYSRLQGGRLLCAECVQHLAKSRASCSTCGRIGNPRTGTQPDGTMNTYFSSASLSGYTECGTILITYRFPSGVQRADHPSPGTKYNGTTRETYLPDNVEGRDVLQLFKIAFQRKLLFTIGTSKTKGKSGVIIWNRDVCQKSCKKFSKDSGIEARFCYPDPSYLELVTHQLAALGISGSEPSTGTSV